MPWTQRSAGSNNKCSGTVTTSINRCAEACASQVSPSSEETIESESKLLALNVYVMTALDSVVGPFVLVLFRTHRAESYKSSRIPSRNSLRFLNPRTVSCHRTSNTINASCFVDLFSVGYVVPVQRHLPSDKVFRKNGGES